MSWTDDLSKDIKARYGIIVPVQENLTLKFKKWHHRVTMDLKTEPSKGVKIAHEPRDILGGIFGRRGSYYKPVLSASTLIKGYANSGLNVHWRSNGQEMFIYTNNIDELLSILKVSHLGRIRLIEYMRPELAESYAAGPVSQYKTSLIVKKSLPYGVYRYKIHVATNRKVRASIGQRSLAAIIAQLKNYPVHFNDKFLANAEKEYAYSDNYFHAETLDWLTMVSLIDPRYIKHIEEIKTLEEVENEQLDPNTAVAQTNS